MLYLFFYRKYFPFFLLPFSFLSNSLFTILSPRNSCMFNYSNLSSSTFWFHRESQNDFLPHTALHLNARRACIGRWEIPSTLWQRASGS